MKPIFEKQYLVEAPRNLSSHSEMEYSTIAFSQAAAGVEAATDEARRMVAKSEPLELNQYDRDRIIDWVRNRERRSRSPWSGFLFQAYRFKPLRRVILQTLERLEGGRFFSRTIRDIVRTYYGIELGDYSWGKTIQDRWLPPGTQIGPYSNFIANVYRRNHTFERISQHPFFYNRKLGLVPKDNIVHDHHNPLVVGHDVHTGFRVLVMANCFRIGDGAYLEAGSVITKDVEPYSIMAGNPARVVGRRFSDEVIAEIQRSEWWNQPMSRLLEEPEVLLNPASAPLIRKLALAS